MSLQIYKKIISNIESDDDFYTKNLLFIGDRKSYFDEIKLLYMDNKLTDEQYEEIINCMEERIGTYIKCENCGVPLEDNESYDGYCYECDEELNGY